ncbi:hypothetical protein SAMN04489761_2383 [Tenacibaculum sp. MAR_2009_124]|uniref:hypothetical protein n=1 Tax=Tenacibaculum sp. MAR_2009_124 TaxID=1250059 RepID=UPI000899ACC5|nr:hypothetical protein [Tenacibaculum sp. MAR_2009_124]SEC20996.1 hypothetical protein SAMN04489761_2383 [Tenacibaculum sp. MAR_2009_124]
MKTKFSTTIMAITGLITAIGGVITILHNVGFLGLKEPNEKHFKVEKETFEKEKETINEKEKVIKSFIPVEKIKVSLSGYWWNKENNNGKYYIEHKRNGEVSFTEYSLMYGQWVSTATGSGDITATSIDIPYTTYVGASGKFTGKVSANGKEIHGFIHDFSAGMKVILNLIKEE